MRAALTATIASVLAGCYVQPTGPSQPAYPQQPPPDQSANNPYPQDPPPPTQVPPSQYPPPAQQPYPQPPPPTQQYPQPQPVGWDSRGWVNLGSQDVQGGRDRDVFTIGRNDYYSALTFVVDYGDVDVRDATVYFSDGQSWSANVRQSFRDGARYRTVELGAPRAIRTVDLRYAARSGRGRMQIWGRPASPPFVPQPYPPQPQPQPQPYPQPQPQPQPVPQPQPAGWDSRGWVLVEQAQVVRADRDHDFVKAGRTDVYTNAITLVVEGGDVELYDVVVTFAEGQSVSTTFRHAFRNGQRTRSIDLGAPRIVKSVQFRNLAVASGKPLLGVWVRPTSPPIAGPQPQPQQPAGDPWVQRGYTVLGETTLNAAKNSVGIDIPQKAARYAKLVIVVEGGSAELADLRVQFTTGKAYYAAINYTFTGSDTARELQFTDDGRTVKNLDFRYTVKNGTPKVRFYAK